MAGRNLWKANLHNLCNTAQSHLSMQVERKLQGHELEIVLLTNFLTERLIMTGISKTIQQLWKISDVLDASDEFLELELAYKTFITRNTRILFNQAHL